MKSLYIVLLITIAWTSSLPVQGQDSINIGTRHSLFSNILNEERMYWIYEPEKQPGEEEKVSANGRNFLVGHSYAGLFTLQVLLDYPKSFDTFMAIDPSLWWDRGVFLKQAEKEVGQKDFSGKQLYVAFATRQRPNVKLDQFALADSLGERIIPEMKSQHLHAIYKKFPDEVHGTIALPGMFDGLKSLFMR